jgi:hypothetical protein
MSITPADPTLFPHYFQYVAKTEPPLIFHRWCMLTSIGAMLGRQFWLPFGASRIFPNMYTMLIGNPGTRKSTAVMRSRRLLAGVGYETFASEKTSKEKFLMDLAGMADEDGYDYRLRPSTRKSKLGSGLIGLEDLIGDDAAAAGEKSPREVFVVADEFNEFVGSGNMEFLSMLGVLWDWDDDSRMYRQRLKTSKSVDIYQPTVSILSGNTHSSFLAAFPPQAVGQGFLSRLLLIYGERPRAKYAFPEAPSEHLTALLMERLSAIRSKVQGPATVDPAAREALTRIYSSWPELDDNRFQYYSSRRYTHLLKLCLVFAAARCSTTIIEFDVLYANTCLTYAESLMPKAMGEFGKSRDSEASTKLMQELYKATRPLTMQKVIEILSHDLEGPREITALLQKLVTGNRIQYVTAGGGGYLPVQKQISNNRLFVDFKLLAEMPAELGGKGDASIAR